MTFRRCQDCGEDLPPGAMFCARGHAQPIAYETEDDAMAAEAPMGGMEAEYRRTDETHAPGAAGPSTHPCDGGWY